MKTLLILLCLSVIVTAPIHGRAEDKRIILVAGRASHGPGDHEHRAGQLLLQKCLASVPGVSTEVVSNGWPKDPAIFEGAAAVIFYCDGGPGHPALQADRLKLLGDLQSRGVGIACLHYAVEPVIEKGQKEFLSWIGGCFEINWSVNPHWAAEFKSLPDHPITRGVKPFRMQDEWYYHMRFADGMKGVTPILSAVPTAATLTRPDGKHSGNPAVREAVARGEAQHVAWAYEAGGGTRGFGFTGGHTHTNWGHDDFRKLVLNAILWVARVEVPPGGVSSTVTAADLAANLDSK